MIEFVNRLPRRMKDHLSPYRRHMPACNKQLNCDCPIWVQGRLNGKPVRQSLATRSLSEADERIREMYRVRETREAQRLPRKIEDHLSPYRRHAATCQRQNVLDCGCPIWVQGRLRGEYIRQSLDTRSLGAAEERIRQMREGTPPDGPGSKVATLHPMTLEEAEAAFLKAKGGQDLASSTMTLYGRAVRDFREFVAAQQVYALGAVTPDHVQDYMSAHTPGDSADDEDSSEEKAAPWQQRTRQSRLKELRLFFSYAVEMQWISRSPAASRALSVTGVMDHAREPFTRPEIVQILNAVDEMPEETRDQASALALLLLYSGMRISDATFLQRTAIDPHTHVLDYVMIKNRKPVTLPMELHASACAAIDKLPETGTPFYFVTEKHDYTDAIRALRQRRHFSKHLPLGLYKRAIRDTTALITDVLERAKLEGACHRFRDTFAVNMLIEGAELWKVAQALGHSSVNITAKHYLNLVPGYRERASTATRVLPDYTQLPRLVKA